MNDRAMAADGSALTSLRAQARTWWEGRAPRERQLVAVMAAVVVFFIAWSIFVQPAWKTARMAPAQIDALDLQLEQMKRTAAQSQGLRGAAPVSAPQAAQALKAATDRLGDKARLTQQGTRATLTLSGVTGDALRAWMSEARSSARARPIEAQLQRGPDGYTGSIVVGLGVGP